MTMHDHDLERMRAYVEERLPPAEREAFAARLRREPELAALTETYGLVVAATDGEVPATTTSFEEVARRLAARRPGAGRLAAARLAAGRLVAPIARRPLLAAAVLLVALGAWWWGGPAGGGAREGRGTVTLSAITLAPLPPLPPPTTWPRALLTHRTADARGLRWYRDLDEALAVARAGSRPVFLFLDYPGCPLCASFRLEQCRDETVIAAADAFVLANLSWADAPEAFRVDPSRGWPAFFVLDREGEERDGFRGLQTPAALAAWLWRVRKVLEEQGGYEFFDWTALRRAALQLELAEAEPSAANRFALWTRAAAGPGDLLPRAARRELAAMERGAQQALLAARDAEPPRARKILDDAAARLAGTPWGEDLRRVRDSLAARGAFPRLTTRR